MMARILRRRSRWGGTEISTLNPKPHNPKTHNPKTLNWARVEKLSLSYHNRDL